MDGPDLLALDQTSPPSLFAMASPAAPANKIERAHQLYRDGRYEEALGFYTEALSVAKIKQQKIALHSNRAACYLKLHDFKKVHLLVSFDANLKIFCFPLSVLFFLLFHLKFRVENF